MDLLGIQPNKVGCAFPMVIVTIMPHAEFGPNDHRVDAPHFTKYTIILEMDPF